MSRSIHTTRQKLISEQRYQLSNNEIKKSRIKKLRDDLDTKRMLKQRKQLSRQLEKVPSGLAQSFNPEAVPVNVVDTGDYIHYLVSRDDLIEVAKRLPVNVMAGIDSINLCLGKEYQDEEYEGIGEKEYDPLVGRICSDKNGPVYSAPILGIYRPSNCKIFLYAYVYDKKELKLDIIEAYLRLKMLITFVHEVAHHDDNMRRSGRGRWLGFNESKCENYAELQQIEWFKQAIIPYLQTKYQQEYTQLLNWIKENGGVEIPLIKLGGNYEGRNSFLIRLGFGIDSAVEYMFQNAAKGESSHDIMLGFARDLHIGDHYDECIKSLETILNINPQDAGALGVKADTLIHLEEYDEAEIIAQDCLNIDPTNLDALEVLCNLQSKRRDWENLKKTSLQGIKYTDSDKWKKFWFLEKNLIASLFLSDYKTAKADIEALPDKKGMMFQRKHAYTALISLLTGETEIALKIAREIMALEKVAGPVKAIMKGVINKALLMFENDAEKYALSEYEEEYLSGSKIGELLK